MSVAAGPGGRRRRARVAVGAAGATVAVVAVAGAAAAGFGGADADVPASSNLPPATTQVTRATLTQTEKASGTLGYGSATTVSVRAGGGGTNGDTSSSGGAGGAASAGESSGTLTWLAPARSTVERGKPVYKVDDKPVPLTYGSMPLYRQLKPGLSGGDVRQLEENLAALGYSGFTVDDDYTTHTATAMRRWQSDLGLTQTGTVGVNQVVVAPGAVRVAELKAHAGDAANGPALTYTGTTRVVTVALDVSKQQLVTRGISATVTLPDGRTVTGTVDSVGTVATATTSGQGAQASSSTTIDVVVSVADQAALGTLDAAPVEVTLVASQKKDVLTVPVGALLALAEGGYGVQVVDGTTARYVAVRTGMFAGGRVEVSGDGIAAGTVVGVPA